MSRTFVGAAVVVVCLSLPARGVAQRGGDTPCVRPPARAARGGGEVVPLTAVSGKGCTLVLRPTGTQLLPATDGSRPDPGLRLVMDRAGRFYTTNAQGYPGTIAVWSPDGKYLRKVGSPGEGPGELSTRGAMSIFVDTRNNLHVRDGSFGWTTFDTAGKFVRRVSSQEIGGIASSTIVLDDGTTLTTQAIPSGGNNHFHVADSTGKRIRSFGTVSEAAREQGLSTERDLAYAGGSTFWAAPASGDPGGYQLQEWTTDGKLLRTIKRDVPWFRATARAVARGREDAPPPQVTGMHLDETGLLVVVLVAPSDKWRYIADPAQRRQQEGELYDSWMEVIDTRSMALLSSERTTPAVLREQFRGFVPGRSHAYRIGETADGLPTIHLLKYELVGR